MLYLGLDVHSKWTTLVGFDPETGEILERERVSNEPEALGSLRAPLHGVMEAGTSAWAM